MRPAQDRRCAAGEGAVRGAIDDDPARGHHLCRHHRDPVALHVGGEDRGHVGQAGQGRGGKFVHPEKSRGREAQRFQMVPRAARQDDVQPQARLMFHRHQGGQG